VFLKVVFLPAAKQKKYLMKKYSKFAYSSYCELISEYFGENRVILLQTVAK